MRKLAPKDVEEVKRVALEYNSAFRTADADRATAMTVLPVIDCIDLGQRAGVYLMSEEDFRHSVEAHANEDYTTEVVSLKIIPFGQNGAAAYFRAKVTKPDGTTGETGWFNFIAHTADGWKVWANWLGPPPEGF